MIFPYFNTIISMKSGTEDVLPFNFVYALVNKVKYYVAFFLN